MRLQSDASQSIKVLVDRKMGRCRYCGLAPLSAETKH